MRSGLIIGVAIFASILLTLGIYWVGDADSNAQADSIRIEAPRLAERGGAGGPPAWAGRGRMMAGPWMPGRGRDRFGELIETLGTLNLRPDFTLSLEQKQKLQAIRDEVANAQVRWRAEQEVAIKKLEEEFRAIREAGGGDMRERLRELFEKRQELMASVPKPDSAIQQVQALLTPEQLKALEAHLEQEEAGADEERRAPENRLGGRRNLRRQGSAENQPAPPQDAQ